LLSALPQHPLSICLLPDGTVENELYDAQHDTRNCHDDAIGVIAPPAGCRHPHHAGLPIMPHFP